MNSQNKKTLQIVLIALISVVTLGIGYAAISAVNLIINGNATATVDSNNFKVKFLSEAGVTPTIEEYPTNTISVDSDTTASFNISTLDRAGQSVTATYKVKNESAGIGAKITLQLTSSNTEYFKVTEKILDNTLQAGEETTVTVKVEMLKTPIDTAVSTTVIATLIATPLENASATGGESKEKVVPIPYVYSINNYDNHNTIGQTLIGESLTFNSAKATFGHPSAIAHILDGTTIEESYVAFERDGVIYYLRGGAGNEIGQASMPIYDYNVTTLKTAFGPDWDDYCEEDKRESNNCFSCRNGISMNAHAYMSGDVYVEGSGWDCMVYGNGDSACEV